MTEKPRTIPAQYLKEPATLIAHNYFDDETPWEEVYEHDGRFYRIEVVASANYPPQTGNATEISEDDAKAFAASINSDEHPCYPANDVTYTEPRAIKGWFD